MASDDLRARIDAVVQRGLAFEAADGDSVPIEITNGVLAVVQPELDRLRAELHRHATCVQCGHERHRHGYEPIIRRDWCADCPTTNDLHTFQTKEAS